MNEYLTRLPFGFPGQIYRSPMPYGVFDPERSVLGLYQKAGVAVVVMLVSDAEAREKTGRDLRRVYTENGMTVIYLPIPDFDIPASDALLSGLDKIQAEAQAGRNVAVHCNAGIGRTGLVIACLARQVFGMPGEQAISWVQQYIEHAVESEIQYSFVQDLELSQAA
jgi:protein-tyrosine phosphatase